MWITRVICLQIYLFCKISTQDFKKMTIHLTPSKYFCRPSRSGSNSGNLYNTSPKSFLSLTLFLHMGQIVSMEFTVPLSSMSIARKRCPRWGHFTLFIPLSIRTKTIEFKLPRIFACLHHERSAYAYDHHSYKQINQLFHCIFVRRKCYFCQKRLSDSFKTTLLLSYLKIMTGPKNGISYYAFCYALICKNNTTEPLSSAVLLS